MCKELDYLDDILKNEPMTLNKRMIIEFIKKDLKALEIIKEKGIDIGWLRQCNTVEEYNYHCEANVLTQEEFDLLKEVLKCQ